MADRDYSATPVWKKLGLREGARAVLLGAPPDLSLGAGMPPVDLLRRPGKGMDVIVLFSTSAAEIGRRFAPLAAALAPAGRLWIAWPKRAARIETDTSFEVVQSIGLGAGLVDNKTASLTEVFQGMQFVVRLRDRPRRGAPIP